MRACADPILELRYAGAALLDLTVLDKHPVPVGALTDREAMRIVECLSSLRQRGEEVATEDALRIEMERRGYFREIQESPWRHAAVCDNPAAIARRLCELYEVRRLRDRAAEMVRALDAHPDAQLAREHLRELVDLRPDGGSGERVKTLREVYIHTAEELFTRDDDSCVRLGWGPIDRVYHLAPGQLLVLGAQTNVGKTSAIAAWSMFIAQRGAACGVISVEDATEDWGAKWLGESSGVNPADLWRAGRRGGPSRAVLERAVSAGLETADLPIYFSEVADRSLDGVLSDMAHMVHRHNVRVVFVDYLQAIMLPAGSRDVRAGTDHNLAHLIAQAGRLRVALVVACQLSRPPKDKAFREPNKHDLKESGTIENRAQCIVLLWRDQDGQTWGKVEKVKRMPVPERPFALGRHPRTGALVVSSEEEDPEYG